MIRNWLRSLFAPTINVQTVEVVIRGEQDPSRLARLTLDAIKKMAEQRMPQ